MADDEPKESSGTDQWDATQFHEVKKGETLWKIAEHYYRNESLYTNILGGSGHS